MQNISSLQSVSSFAKLIVVIENVLYLCRPLQLSFLYLPYETIGLPSSFVFYALVDIVIRFFDTDLSVLIAELAERSPITIRNSSNSGARRA